MNECEITGTNSWAWLNIGDHFIVSESLYWEDFFSGLIDAPDWIPSGSTERADTIRIIRTSMTPRG